MTEPRGFFTIDLVEFANPMFLWAVGLAVVPLWLHLSRRRKFKRLETGTLRFLKDARRSRTRKARWEEILLMLLRVVATILLALLFARPTLPAQAPKPEEANRVIVLLDASGSMTDAMAAEARKQAEKAMRKYGGESSLTLAQFSDRVATMDSLDEYRPRPGSPSRFDSAISWALDRFLENGAPDGGRLVLVGHFARSALPENPPRVWPSAVGVDLVPILPKKSINSAVTEVELRTPYANAEMEIEARLHLPPDQAASVVLEVEGFVEEKEILPGTERVLFQFRPSRDRVRGWVRLDTKSDAWPDDDRRPFVFQWVERSRVLLVDGDPGGTPFEGEAYFIKKALEASGAEHGLSPFVAEISYGLQNRTGMLSLAEYDAIVLCGVEGISSGECRELEVYIENGGGLFVVPGTGWGPALYSPLTDVGLFPERVGDNRGETTRRIADLNTEHPGLAPFARADSGDLRSLPWNDGYEIQISEGDDWEVIARLEGGRPILAASKSKRILVCPHPLNRDWTDLPREPVFVPFIKGLFSWLCDAGEPPVPARTVVPGIEEEREPGWYLFGEDRPPDVVVGDPAESDFAVVELEEAAAALGLPFTGGENGANAGQESREALARSQFSPRPRELWPWIAVLLLAWFVVEGIVATGPKPGESRM